MCAFRCLALHRKQNHIEESVKLYYQQWKQYLSDNCERIIPESMKRYDGVELHELPHFERCFEIMVTVCELKEDGVVIARYHPTTRFQDNLYMNMHKRHLSYITKFEAYSKKFQCAMCNRLFSKLDQVKRHSKVCSNITKHVLPGGHFTQQHTIFDELEQLGIVVPMEKRFFSWFSSQRVDSQGSEVPNRMKMIY